MTRKTISTLSDVIFGSKTRGEVFYYLAVVNDSWISAYDIGLATGLDRKSVRNILTSIALSTFELQRKDRFIVVREQRAVHIRSTGYRLDPEGVLVRALRGLIPELYSSRRYFLNGREFWSIGKKQPSFGEPYDVYYCSNYTDKTVCYIYVNQSGQTFVLEKKKRKATKIAVGKYLSEIRILEYYSKRTR